MQPEIHDGNKTAVAISRSAPQAQQQPKALRFVTNYGAPHPKRRRIGAACMTCRKRKTACSGEKPFCDTCKQNKLECAGYATETTAAPETSRKKQRREDAHSARKVSADGRDAGSVSPERTDRPAVAATKSYASDHQPQRLVNDQSKARGETDLQTSQTVTSPRGRDRAERVSNGSPTGNRQESLLSNDSKRNRMPYFRWLGPTAIMPGFKQMVVKVKPKDPNDVQSTSSGGVRSPSHVKDGFDSRVFDTSPATVSSIDRTPVALPFYDTSPMPPSELITHLVATFFTHLGCNYPFLQRERFLRDLEDKRVDALLVDAVCALAARFSTHSLLIQAARAGDGETGLGPAEYGHAFAQRAKVALIDRFHCPSVAAAQAALLLAYNEFGEQKDSGLWMYLGIAIRFAQDLGMHKGEGLRFVGNEGPTPKKSKRASFGEEQVRENVHIRNSAAGTTRVKQEDIAVDYHGGDDESGPTIEEQRANEQEYVDTFWAIFFLDRVVSSGTGRRSTLRDKDIEVSFPAASRLLPPPRQAPSAPSQAGTEWPAPFPALIRIVHLYGRVADLLNSIKEPGDISPELPSTLAAMETNVTNFYQALSPRLHFDAVNFQYYMKAGEGTNFVLLHFWFHTLIILLHQPTLLKTFSDDNAGVSSRLQLFPNSSKLAMSSAKTIADILSYSQLMDAKASLGNPFTTQPIYIAAKVFLKEVKEQTAGSSAASCVTSRGQSPERNGTKERAEGQGAGDSVPKTGSATATNKMSAAASTKHALLATAASQHYQLCYKALQSLETYWAGTKYILTVLEQQFAGNLDPLLYTEEEEESAMERPRPEPGFEKPAWRGRRWSTMNIFNLLNGGSGDQPSTSMRTPGQPGSGATQNVEDVGMGGMRFGGAEMSWLQNFGQGMPMYFPGLPGSPMPGPGGADGGQAIGWTMTGTMNSPSTNLAWHYTSGNASSPANVSNDLGNISGSAPGSAFDQFAGFAAGQKSSLPHGRDFPPGSASSGQNSQSLRLPTSNSHDLPAGYTPQEQQHHRSFSANALPAYAMGASGGANVGPYPSPSMTNPALAASANAHSTSPITPGVPAGLHAQGAASGATLGPATPSLLFPQTPGDTMMIESQDVDMSLLGLDMMPWFETFPTHDLDAFSAMASGTPIPPAGTSPEEGSRAIPPMQRRADDAGRASVSPR